MSKRSSNTPKPVAAPVVVAPQSESAGEVVLTPEQLEAKALADAAGAQGGEGDEEGDDQNGSNDDSGDQGSEGPVSDSALAAASEEASEEDKQDPENPLLQEMDWNPLSDEAVDQQSRRVLIVEMLEHDISEYVRVMGPATPHAIEVGVNAQVNLFNLINRVLSSSGAEFIETFNALLKAFKEGRRSTFSEAYVYRYFDMVPLSKTQRTAFISIVNLLMVTCDHDSRAEALQHIDLPKVCSLMVVPEAGERLQEFYSM